MVLPGMQKNTPESNETRPDTIDTIDSAPQSVKFSVPVTNRSLFTLVKFPKVVHFLDACKLSSLVKPLWPDLDSVIYSTDPCLKLVLMNQSSDIFCTIPTVFVTRDARLHADP